MKKALFLILVFALLMGAPVMAATDDSVAVEVHGKNVPQLQMTADQKAKMISLKTQMLELKKQIIKYNLEQGTITTEQAKKMEDRINAKLEALKSGELGQKHRFHSPKLQPKV